MGVENKSSWSWYYITYGQGINKNDYFYKAADLLLETPVLKYSQSGIDTGKSPKNFIANQSKLFFTNFNSFAQSGGFDALLHAISFKSNEDPEKFNTPLEVLASYVFLFSNQSQRILSSFYKSYSGFYYFI
jgi:hypothetical protein